MESSTVRVQHSDVSIHSTRKSAGQRPVLGLTGERTLPGLWQENYWFRRHEAAYLGLVPFAGGAVVLEAGIGEGYGAALLAEQAGRVVGLELDRDAAAHAAEAYRSVTVARADVQSLPVADGAVEVVANLQTLEHLADQEGFIAECARVLRPAGTLLLTTPNPLTFSPGRDIPLNPFHTREVSMAELIRLLVPHFEVTRRLGLRHGRRLCRWEGQHGLVLDALLAAGPNPAAWPGHVTRMVRGVRAADFVLSDESVDTSLDLVVVAWRRT